MSRAADALAQIDFARRYSLELLRQIPTEDWFRMPKDGVTHVAWQVGHLAYAEWRLALERIRGEREADKSLISKRFRELFIRGSNPTADAGAYPSPAELRTVLDAVHAQVQKEVSQLDDQALEVPCGPPQHRLFTTKHGALSWCSHHEMLHAGQIGLLRRLLGSPAVW